MRVYFLLKFKDDKYKNININLLQLIVE